MKMLSTLLILLAINLPNGVYLEITEEEVCSTSNPFKYFKVMAAFKVDRYLGIVGNLGRGSDIENASDTVALRVMHWHQPDPSGETKHEFYETKIWKEIQDINKEKAITYAFTTRHVETFKPQKNIELVFTVQDTNLTTAYQFDPMKVRKMSEPTFDANTDKKVVYDPKENWDNSGFLRIKYLFLHFPHELKILGIFIYDRKKLIRINNGPVANGNGLNTTKQSDTLYQAIVYTEELFGGKYYYFRHYLVSVRHEYKDDLGVTYSSLDWAFDERKDFCGELSAPPTAIVMLNKEDETFYLKEKTDHKLFIRFIEFYGLKHKVMRITFPDAFADSYFMSVEQMIDPHSGNRVDTFDNAVSLLNCKTHPIEEDPKPIVCDSDYGNPEHLPQNLVKQSMEGSLTSDYSDNTFVIITVVVALVMIISLIALLVMSIVKE